MATSSCHVLSLRCFLLLLLLSPFHSIQLLNKDFSLRDITNDYEELSIRKSLDKQEVKKKKMVDPHANEEIQAQQAMHARMIRFIAPLDVPFCSSSSVAERSRRSHRLQGSLHRSMLLNEGKRIIMDWSPKSACTKMVEMFWNEMGIKRGVHYPNESFLHLYRPDFYRQCGYVTQNMLDSPGYYKFKVVRNPYFRAVSSYIHIMDHSIAHTFLERVSPSIMNKTADRAHPLNNMSFEDFLKYYLEHVHLRPNKVELRNGAIVHFQQQCSDVELECFKRQKSSIFNRVVHIENFNQDIKIVNLETRMNFSYPNGFDSHEAIKHAHENAYRGNWSFSMLKGNIPEDYGKFYNALTIRLVSEIFQDDLLVYNYSYPFQKVYR